jgi:hypothetical protein
MHIDKTMNIYKSKLILLELSLNIVFILYTFGIANVRIIFYIHGQTLQTLIHTENYEQPIMGRRENNENISCI